MVTWKFVNLVWWRVFLLVLDFVSEYPNDVGVEGRFGQWFWFRAVGSGFKTRGGGECG